MPTTLLGFEQINKGLKRAAKRLVASNNLPVEQQEPLPQGIPSIAAWAVQVPIFSEPVDIFPDETYKGRMLSEISPEALKAYFTLTVNQKGIPVYLIGSDSGNVLAKGKVRIQRPNSKTPFNWRTGKKEPKFFLDYSPIQ
ncbi:MAG: hypothetical protein VKJ06_03165 [Vampirovibrionales bacterium]|nr:hypothetical protein [Vampirovibrionales bacterium]